MVYPGLLSPIPLSSGIQRSFSLICTPHAPRPSRPRHPQEESRTHLRPSPTRQNRTNRRRLPDRRILRYPPTEADLTAGHGIPRYTGLITITATTIEDLDAHVAALEQAAIQANCETRLLAGQQAQAFTAAALPLCRQA
ncbi:SCO6880 family protein [Schaalia hyovaginalis]|uniref:SCO6880 family protein n=1 Tax=Schaalia hyovaginalis TaxID=29316 RepID=UPI0038B2EFCF